MRIGIVDEVTMIHTKPYRLNAGVTPSQDGSGGTVAKRNPVTGAIVPVDSYFGVFGINPWRECQRVSAVAVLFFAVCDFEQMKTRCAHCFSIRV
jgi:hypothetical protein